MNAIKIIWKIQYLIRDQTDVGVLDKKLFERLNQRQTYL